MSTASTTTKPWYKSLTLWLNLLALVVYLINGLGFQQFTPDPWVTEVGGILLAVANIIIRTWRTSQPIA
jgi:hypothetical protein